MLEQLRINKQSQELVTLDSTVDNYHTVSGYATTYNNVDMLGDVIQKGAFDDSLRLNNRPVILWQHQIEVPIGTGILQDSDYGVMLTAQLPKNDDFVKNRVMPQLQAGSVKSFSIGMIVDRNSVQYKKDSAVITKASIIETSLVTFPINPLAEIISVKSLVQKSSDNHVLLPLADEDLNWDSGSAIKRIREFTNSKDAPSVDYKRAFLWYDTDNKDNFTAYKLPIADVIDGELKAIPRALSAATAAVNGARGGLDVSDSDLMQIKSTIRRYYDKMNKSDPFAQKQWSIDEVKSFTSKRDVENILRESGLFSKSASVYLASCFDFKQREFVNDQNALHKAFEHELKQLANFLRMKTSND